MQHSATVFAAVGDVHGLHHQMVRQVQAAARRARVEIAFVMQVGDFEPHRHTDDVATMAAPAKYRRVGDFPDFYEGRATFPWPVWFIGGNHEPYGLLDTVPSGAEIAPRCFWWGRAARRTLKGITIAGLSGIAVEGMIDVPRPPITEIGSTKKKAYIHFTEDEVVSLLSDDPVDILVVHDWPQGAYTGTEKRRRAASADRVGNEWARLLVDTLQPKLVLGGHMHWAHRSLIGRSQFAGLADVASGEDSVALFRHTPQGIEEIFL